MKYAFLAIFTISVIIHLYASLQKDKRLRNLSKPFIVMSLLGFYVQAASSISVMVILALIFSWIGDVLLMPKGNKWLTAGGISFIISHVFLILRYWQDVVFSKISLTLSLCLAGFFLLAVVIIFSRLKKYIPKNLVYPMFLYLFINGAMNCYAVFRCVSIPSKAAVITAVGAALFFISDSVQFFVRFKKNSRLKTHFVIMLTYSLGELLIVLGLI